MTRPGSAPAARVAPHQLATSASEGAEPGGKKRILANEGSRRKQRRARQPWRARSMAPNGRRQNVVPPEKLKTWVWSYLPLAIGNAKSKRMGPIGEAQIRLAPTDARIWFGSHTLAQLNWVMGIVPAGGQ